MMQLLFVLNKTNISKMQQQINAGYNNLQKEMRKIFFERFA